MTTETTSHLADTAKPGDAFYDERGLTWLKIGFVTIYSWVVAGPGAAISMTTDDARKHTLTKLVPEGSERSAMETLHTMLGKPANVVDAVAKLIDRDAGYLPEPDASDPAQLRRAAKIVRSTQNAITESVLAGIRAARDAAKAGA